MVDSKPYLCSFDPRAIPYQYDVIKFIRWEWDHSKGAPEILLSGSIGSSKSIVLAHLAITHCLAHKGACALLGRQNLKDLKDTLIQEVINHMSLDLIEGKHYEYNRSDHSFRFANGSKILSRSWGDKNFEQFRSLKLSAGLVEEASENDAEYEQFYSAIYSRLGRTDAQVKENFMISATNPDSPSHWLHKRFSLGNEAERNPMRKVWYSKTFDNPFLPDWYVENQKQNYDDKMYRRMVLGLWEEIDEEKPYYNYTSDKNYIGGEKYLIQETFPIDLMFDFNIGGEEKPMSAAVGQMVGESFHVLQSFIVEGARTLDIMEEIQASGLLDKYHKFRIFGDASGKSRNTRSIKSDYDIIKEFLANYKREDGVKLEIEYLVPLANPPIRERHNVANALFSNATGKVNFYCYDKNVDEGFRLTRFKKGGNYLEDDNYRFQHVTTAVTYWTHYMKKRFKGPVKAPYRR